MKSEQSHAAFGFRAFSLFDPRRYALQVLADVLGGGMSSRLFKRVREELGAAYYIGAGADLLLDHQSLMFSLLNPAPVKQLLLDHQSRRQDNHKLLFSLVMFEQWLRTTRSAG